MIEPRDEAVQKLYAADRLDDGEIDISDVSSKARRLIEGVLARFEELDEGLAAASDNWKVERMPVIDRAILRLGLYELRHEPSTPTGVIISEAVRIAKEYSTERSGAFVNGVLAALAGRERPHEHPRVPGPGTITP